jgi:DNA-binding IclR family transcriptional regulator
LSETYRVPALTAATRVLSALTDAGGDGISQADVARATGVSKSSTHNLLWTLEAEGFVRRDPRTRRYHLGGALIALGVAASQQMESVALAVDCLPRIAGGHNVSAAVAVVTRDGDAQVLNGAFPPQPVHVGIRIGSRYGYFDGAIGKCLLAAMDPERARKVVCAQPIPVHTDRTVTEPARLLEEIAAVRARGWGTSIGELNSNIAVAATIFDAGGTAEAVLVALAFPNELDDGGVATIGQALRDEAAFITHHAGGTAPGLATTDIDSARRPAEDRSPVAQLAKNGGTRNERLARN